MIRWEVVVFFQKGLSAAIPAYNQGSSLRQAVGMMFVSLIYSTLLFKCSPFANKLMNMVAMSANFMIFMMYFCAVLFVCDIEGAPVLNDVQQSVVAGVLSLSSCFVIILLIFAALYESFFLMLFHHDIFVSKWIQSLETAIGDSVKPNGLFSYFYTYYNPISRIDIKSKKQALDDALFEPLTDLHAKIGHMERGTFIQQFWFSFRMWLATYWIKFKHMFLVDCRPAVVLEASQRPESIMLRCLNKIEQKLSGKRVVLKKSENLSLWNRCNAPFIAIFKKLRFLLRRKKVVPVRAALPDSNDRLGETDPPKEFLDWLLLSHEFLNSSFSNETICILLTLLIFDNDSELKSREAKNYLARMRNYFVSYKQSIKKIFALVRELEDIDVGKGPSSLIAELNSRKDSRSRFWTRISSALLGGHMICLDRFSRLTNQDISKLLLDKEFDDADGNDTVSLNSLITAGTEQEMQTIPAPLPSTLLVAPPQPICRNEVRPEGQGVSSRPSTLKSRASFDADAARSTSGLNSSPPPCIIRSTTLDSDQSVPTTVSNANQLTERLSLLEAELQDAKKVTELNQQLLEKSLQNASQLKVECDKYREQCALQDRDMREVLREIKSLRVALVFQFSEGSAVSSTRPRFSFAMPGSFDEILQDELGSYGILGEGVAEGEAVTLSAIQAECIGAKIDLELARKSRQGAGAVASDQKSYQVRAAVAEAKCEELAEQMREAHAKLNALQSQYALSSHNNPSVQSSLPSSAGEPNVSNSSIEVHDENNTSATSEMLPSTFEQSRPPTFSPQEFEEALHEADPDALHQALAKAVSLRDQHRYEEAERIYRDCLESCERVHGVQHASTLQFLNSIADILQRQHKFNDAERAYVLCVQLCTKTLGRFHAGTLGTMHSLGCMYRSQQRHSDAAKLFAKLLERQQRQLGHAHPETLECKVMIADLNEEMGDIMTAHRMYSEVIDASKTVQGSTSRVHTLQWTQKRDALASRLQNMGIVDSDSVEL
jgi:tetratricopeptide (TPR) repeat protein